MAKYTKRRVHLSATLAWAIEMVEAHPDDFEPGALAYYEARKAAGDKLVDLSGECDDFDAQTGCRGHEEVA
jgi:hypothetical protein